ncbi:hypothetical protein KC19_N025100 [Ceratodon purpureus]|nr:hypothetical protein KC19_N025100 [Ceratodon purpureus]
MASFKCKVVAARTGSLTVSSSSLRVMAAPPSLTMHRTWRCDLARAANWASRACIACNCGSGGGGDGEEPGVAIEFSVSLSHSLDRSSSESLHTTLHMHQSRLRLPSPAHPTYNPSNPIPQPNYLLTKLHTKLQIDVLTHNCLSTRRCRDCCS